MMFDNEYYPNGCECPEWLEASPSSSGVKSSEENDPNFKYIDFGFVEVGTTKKLKLTLNNNQDVENVFTVFRESNWNPLYETFEIKTHTYKIPPTKDAEVNIYYKPMFVNTKNITNFVIIDQFENVIKLNVVGVGIGPEVQVSTKSLKFFTSQGDVKKTFELKNCSEYDAVFSFDCDTEDAIFSVDQIFGTIKAKSHVYINVTFNPRDHGSFGYNLTCLISNHDPIIINLFGTYSPKGTPLLNYSDDISGVNKNVPNYERYMEDVQEKSFYRISPYFLSKHYLDFMDGTVPENKYQNPNTLLTKVTNNTTDAVLVNWHNGDNFKIEPQKAWIHHCSAAIFQCSFTPSKPNSLYSKTAVAMISSKTDNGEFPWNLTLRLLGHSFDKDTFWLPQLEIPEVVILPPGIPFERTHQTFPLISRSHLPISFHFIPPKNTNFLIKPMVGVVKGTKLICVQLSSDANKEGHEYNEKWELRLNGQKTHSRCFYIKGYSEGVRVVIGDNNKIKMAPVQKGCYERVMVPVTNTSLHSVQYNFVYDYRSPIIIKQPVGELAPKESKYVDFYFKGSKVKGSKIFSIPYIVNLLKTNIMMYNPVQRALEINIESLYSELCCTPNCYNFGTIEINTRQVVNFHLFNFGETTLYYKLYCLDNDDNAQMDITIVPDIGMLKPRSSLKTAVLYKAHFPGQQKMDIFYKIRRSQLSLEVVPDSQKKIFTMKSDCIDPYLQITEIVYHNYGPNFSKTDLWNMLNLDEMNKALRTIKKDQKCCVELRVPDHEVTDASYNIVLLLKNPTKFKVDVQFKQNKQCDCKLVEIKSSLSFRKYEYVCPHRKICKMHMTDNEIPGNSTQLLHLELNYTCEGLNYVKYCLRFGNYKSIEMIYRLMIFSPSVKTVSMYKHANLMKCSPICLSEFDPKAEVFWLYNNSSTSVKYSLDTKLLKEFNFESGFKAFEFLLSNGIIEPFSTSCLIIKYTPIENQTFELNLPFQLGDELSLLRLNVQGTQSINSFKNETKMLSSNVNIDECVVLSEDHLNIEPFPVWSTTTRMIFIKNLYKDIIGYSWQKFTIEGLIDVKVDYPKGVLLPGESHTVIIKIQSFKTACKLNLNFSCKLLNQTQYFLHKQSLAAYNAREDEINQEIAFYDNEPYEPPINKVKVIPFPNIFHTGISLNIEITSIADRCLHYTPEEQFMHSPPHQLKLKYHESCSEQIDSIVDPLEKPIETIITKMGNGKNVCSEEEKNGEEIFDEDKENVEFYKNVMECIVTDSVFSTTFRSVLNMQHEVPPLQYSQITADNDTKPTRSELIKDLYNDPPAPVVGAVLQEVITDSLHETFKLGPQTKNRPRCDHLEDIKKQVENHKCCDDNDC